MVSDSPVNCSAKEQLPKGLLQDAREESQTSSASKDVHSPAACRLTKGSLEGRSPQPRLREGNRSMAEMGSGWSGSRRAVQVRTSVRKGGKWD